jgi:hypothetical protein
LLIIRHAHDFAAGRHGSCNTSEFRPIAIST